jgi:hypothetical protein
VALRNALSHPVPEWMPVRAPGTALQRRFRALVRRVEPSPLMTEAMPFYPYRLLGHGCAAWAADTAVAFIDQFCRTLGVPAPYEHVRSALQTL